MLWNDQVAGPLVDEYLAALDDEIALEEAVVGCLKGMADAVAARDERALERLLGEAADTQSRMRETQARRTHLGARLADGLVGAARPATLAALAAALPDGPAGAVERRRLRIEGLAGECRRQHLRTAGLLVECARLNRALLVGLFPHMRSARTYGAGGRAAGGPDGGLLDARS